MRDGISPAIVVSKILIITSIMAPSIGNIATLEILAKFLIIIFIGCSKSERTLILSKAKEIITHFQK